MNVKKIVTLTFCAVVACSASSAFAQITNPWDPPVDPVDPVDDTGCYKTDPVHCGNLDVTADATGCTAATCVQRSFENRLIWVCSNHSRKVLVNTEVNRLKIVRNGFGKPTPSPVGKKFCLSIETCDCVQGAVNGIRKCKIESSTGGGEVDETTAAGDPACEVKPGDPGYIAPEVNELP